MYKHNEYETNIPQVIQDFGKRIMRLLCRLDHDDKYLRVNFVYGLPGFCLISIGAIGYGKPYAMYNVVLINVSMYKFIVIFHLYVFSRDM